MSDEQDPYDASAAYIDAFMKGQHGLAPEKWRDQLDELRELDEVEPEPEPEKP